MGFILGITLDAIVRRIAAFGVPGLVLLVVTATSGLAGGAAIVASLAVLGGPAGMVGGIGSLILISMIAQGLAKYGIEAIFKGVIDSLKKEGLTNKKIEETISGYWFLSNSVKNKLKKYVRMWGEGE